MQYQLKTVLAGMMIAAFTSAPAMADSPATESQRMAEVGYWSQDGEAGYRIAGEWGRPDDNGAMNDMTKRIFVTEHPQGDGTYGQLAGGVGWGAHVDPDTYWRLFEVGARMERFSVTVQGPYGEAVEHESEIGLYVASDYETWWSDWGLRGRAEYALIEDYGGVNLRVEGLHSLNTNWQLAAAYERVGSGYIEEDTLTLGVRFGW